MIKQQKRENIKLLHSVLASYADSLEAKEYLKYFIRESETTLDEIELELIDAIHDGLRYGNWPWTIDNLKKNQ